MGTEQIAGGTTTNRSTAVLRRPASQLVLEEGADASQTLSQARAVDAAGVRIAALRVLAVAAFEQDVVRPDHVAGVEAGLEP